MQRANSRFWTHEEFNRGLSERSMSAKPLPTGDLVGVGAGIRTVAARASRRASPLAGSPGPTDRNVSQTSEGSFPKPSRILPPLRGAQPATGSGGDGSRPTHPRGTVLGSGVRPVAAILGRRGVSRAPPVEATVAQRCSWFRSWRERLVGDGAEQRWGLGAAHLPPPSDLRASRLGPQEGAERGAQALPLLVVGDA